MGRKFILGVTILATAGLAIAFAQTKGPTNGPELADILNDKYNLGLGVDNDGNIFVASFSASEVGDVEAAIDRIVKIPTIQRLQIDDAHLNKGSFTKLRTLPKLSAIRLLHCKFDDDDIEGLKELPLKELDITGTPITDAGLACLGPLKNLGRLKLSSTKVTGSGFKHFESLPIQELDLTDSPIVDDSLESLGKIRSLRFLNLYHTPITDEGIMQLSGLYQLIELTVNQTKVTADGREAFQEAYNAARTDAEQRGLLPPNHPKLVIGYQ